MSDITTCQICGRPIKANTGVIAHHGYRRPGAGWQTASCMGARHLPYEQSCDLIPVAIERVNAFIAREKAFLADFLANPPDALFTERRAFGGRRAEFIEVPRPDGFDPASRRRTHRPYAYDTLYFQRRQKGEGEIDAAWHDLAYLQERLANWKAPEGAAVQS